jgi:uncharacterized membrane protein YgcG
LDVIAIDVGETADVVQSHYACSPQELHPTTGRGISPRRSKAFSASRAARERAGTSMPLRQCCPPARRPCARDAPRLASGSSGHGGRAGFSLGTDRDGGGGPRAT